MKRLRDPSSNDSEASVESNEPKAKQLKKELEKTIEDVKKDHREHSRWGRLRITKSSLAKLLDTAD